jgi:hypothetical protein
MRSAANAVRPRSGWDVSLLVWTIVAAGAAILVPPPQAPPALRALFVVLPVVVFSLLLAGSASLRARLAELNPRWLVAAHGVRLAVGVAFLWLGQRRLVPWTFAVQAGTGDMIAGAGAIILAIGFPKLDNPGGRWVLLSWNLLGVLDFVNVQRVVGTLSGRGDEFVAMADLPMALVPYWGVPLLWSVHVYLIVRHFAIRQSRSSSPP